jgi:hypothetical protein
LETPTVLNSVIVNASPDVRRAVAEKNAAQGKLDDTRALLERVWREFTWNSLLCEVDRLGPQLRDAARKLIELADTLDRSRAENKQ